MVAIADTFTALVCKRPYKDSWPSNEALAYIEAQSKIRFSPTLVGIFIPLARNDDRVATIFEPVIGS